VDDGMQPYHVGLFKVLISVSGGAKPMEKPK
jgi:hypothetical protein